jgi:hypothetical protein
MSIVGFADVNGIKIGQADGLIIALVNSEQDFQPALQALQGEISQQELRKPGVSGQLILHPDLRAHDLSDWARKFDLANQRIGLHIAEDPDLELAAQERFNTYLNGLKWGVSTTAPHNVPGSP